MNNRGAFCVDGRAYASEHCRDTRADIDTQRGVDSALKTNESADTHTDNNRRGDGRTLDDRSDDRAKEQKQKWVGGSVEQVAYGFDFGNLFHCATHNVETDEEHAHTRYDRAYVAHVQLFGSLHKCANARHCRKKRRDWQGLERNDLGGDSRAYIGAHYDRGGLSERHNAGVDEAHYHDRRGGRTLDNRRHARADRNARKSIVADFVENRFQRIARNGFEVVAHSFDAYEEHAKTGKHHQDAF